MDPKPLRPHQRQHGNLRRHPYPQRRTPVAGAPVDINPGAVVVVQIGDVRMRRGDDVVERGQLAAVGVPRQL